MVRTFVTSISLQSKHDLGKGIYKPDGFILRENVETSFPIIPIIKEHMEKKEDVRVVVLGVENNDVKGNYAVFLEELGELGIAQDQIYPIPVEENQNKAIGLDALVKIIDLVPEESLVYADITFGTKPMSTIMLYAMSFVEKIKGAEAAGIYYGELPRENRVALWDKAKLYNLTSYKHLLDIIEHLNGLRVQDLRAALQTLIDM